MKAYRGTREDIKLNSFVSFTINAGQWSDSGSGRISSGKEPIELVGPQNMYRRFGKKKILSLQDFLFCFLNFVLAGLFVLFSEFCPCWTFCFVF